MESVSVIIPALDEESSVAAAAASARAAGADEVVVADGGSADGTVAAARSSADLVVVAPRGRARQMNAGAAASSGSILLFLHADTTLPAGAAASVREALRDPAVSGGAFRVRLSVSAGASRPARAILAATGRMIGLRSRLFRAYTGDQAIFLRRALFEEVGGFPEIPLMEDVELSRRLSRRGRTLLLPLAVATSARRWEARGVLRTILLMWGLRGAYAAGVPPERCAALYTGKSGR